MPIPETRVRLKAYTQIETVPGGYFLDPSAPVSLAALQAIPGRITIGAAQYLEINQIREENQFFRQFIVDPTRPERAAAPAETYPGLIKYELTLRRVELYDANLIEAFRVIDAGSGMGKNIIDQFRPLILYVTQYAPNLTIGNSPVGTPVGGPKTLGPVQYILPGCWFNALPMQFDVTDTNQAFIAETGMVAQDVIAA
jgi:hypothetical protein